MAAPHRGKTLEWPESERIRNMMDPEAPVTGT